MHRTRRPIRLSGVGLALLVAAAIMLAAHARGDTMFSVSLNTSGLDKTADYVLDFQFNDGSGTDDGNNTATISNFDFGTGTSDGLASTIGGASGDVNSSVVITDNFFLNDLQQAFKPGDVLSFSVNVTGNVDLGSAPDQFGFTIYDSAWNNLSLDPTGALITADLPPDTSSGVTITSASGAQTDGVTVSAALTAAPLPMSALSGAVLLGVCGGIGWVRRKRARIARGRSFAL